MRSDPTLPHIAVHIHTQHCLGCSRLARWSHVYECLTQGNVRRNLPARDRNSWPSDYEIIATEMPLKYVPICHECLPNITPEPDHAAATRWQQTLARKREEARTPTTPTPTTKVTPTLDML